jgi:hypothetical protein
VYDIRPTRFMDMFAKTTHKMGKYLARTIKNGSEFRNAFDPEKLGFEIIDQPPEPEDLNNPVLVKRWEFAYKTYHDQVQHWLIASGQAFAVVLGWCLPALVDQNCAHDNWATTSKENGVVGLIRLIWSCMYRGAT